MGYIRDRKELRTGYQEVKGWAPELDLQCDFVMAYGFDDTLGERIQKFREKGYEVCLMTGCAWGTYDDYLSGRWDGAPHWDESQTDRDGRPILHGVNIPYMVPTENFTKYLAEKVCGLVDQGISAIFMEEPEFWEAGGYSPAFQKEYQAFYKEAWQAPHSSLDARYRCARLKTYLYARLADQLSRAVKEYSRSTYGRETGFYVATHSLVNYTQWKILSPESRMLDMDCIDGFIAQVWSGTSGTGNVYEGHYKSRTFETAYFEYGIMQELIRNTEKKMWFLHDPVEDFPENGWDVYRRKYLKTLTASLFWTGVDRYEVCPWPNRVFNGRYPKKLGMAEGMIPTTDLEGAKDIPKEYATMISGMIQLLGDMQQETSRLLGNEAPVGILMSDTSLYQRSFPDELPANQRNLGGAQQKMIRLKGLEEAVNHRVVDGRETEDEEQLYQEILKNPAELYAYISGCAYPNFFGIAMPLLKYGLPVRPVYLEHTMRYKNDLDAYRYLIVSYEYMKPEHPSCNEALADWVKRGGCLIYIGDGSDPYHTVKSWWNAPDGRETFQSPAEHLFSKMGLPNALDTGIYAVGKGIAALFKAAPAWLTTDRSAAAEYRGFVRNALGKAGYFWQETNSLVMERGPYRIITVMDESCSTKPYCAEGLFTDLLAEGYPVVHEITVPSGEEGLLFDYAKVEDATLRVIATAARIEKLECGDRSFEVHEKAADRIHVNTRIRLPFRPVVVEAVDEDGGPVALYMEWEEASRTVLLSYESQDQLVKITGRGNG